MRCSITPRFVCALVCLTIASLDAQIVSVPDANAKSGRANTVPLGAKGGQSQNIRTQILVPARYFPSTGSEIRDLAFASAGVGTYRYSRFQIRIARLPAARSGKLGKVFANNVTASVSVLDKTSHSYTFKAVDTWHRVGLTTGFKHDGKSDVVVDIVVQGAFFDGPSPGSRRSSTLQSVYLLGYSSTKTTGFGPYLAGAKLQFVLSNGSLVYVGTGCKASNNRSPDLTLDAAPALGLRTKAILKNVPAKLPTLLFFGTSDRSYGSISLPFKLDAAGAAGCTLRTDILLILSGVADANGRVEIPLLFPSEQKFSGQQVTMQGAVLDAKANAFGMALSRMAKAKL